MTLVTQVTVIEMDGRRLYYTFIAGARKVIEHQVELNKINVFPVNDGDTGTNLASTIRAVVDSLHPHRSYKITADRIAETTLVNARGNSRIIFAQFLYGMSTETGNFKTITIKQFAESIKNSVRYIYEAVANPVEGTLLTVIKDWANYIYDNRNRITDFNQLFISSVDILNKSLIATKSKLAVLTKANVVDAGARGFVFFVEGIIDFIEIILWIIGFCFEAGGDIQLAKFKSDPANKGSIMDKGLWRYTRHPNYFGDSTIWLGYGFLCLSSGSYLPVIGSLLMIVLIIKVSGVALLEKSLKVKKPQYKEYIEKTNAFIPWFPKRPPIQ